nr:TRAP transporter large permease subunit [Vicinamibacterales bacterium]
ALMLAVFALLLVRARWPIGVSLAVAAWAGAAANGEWLPLRHLVEGASSYLDALLVIATAMLFMRALADAGALGALAAAVERRFGRTPSVLLPVVMLIVMFPGMMTGSSTASVLTTGSMAATVLGGLGLPRERAAAFVAMGGVLGMIAPPINIPAMIIGAGIDLPYVGWRSARSRWRWCCPTRWAGPCSGGAARGPVSPWRVWRPPGRARICRCGVRSRQSRRSPC